MYCCLRALVWVSQMARLYQQNAPRLMLNVFLHQQNIFVHQPKANQYQHKDDLYKKISLTLLFLPGRADTLE